jgi:hypothetical protein
MLLIDCLSNMSSLEQQAGVPSRVPMKLRLPRLALGRIEIGRDRKVCIVQLNRGHPIKCH